MVASQRRDGAVDGFRFRVSDSVNVPLRGRLLRLRLLDGAPSIKELAIGRRIRLAAPGTAERVVTIKDHAVTGGRQTQGRLDRTRELDVIISDEDAGAGESLVDIGWVVSGPVHERGAEAAR